MHDQQLGCNNSDEWNENFKKTQNDVAYKTFPGPQ
jgi:hypothetical protein